jgi:hypothetical protein
MWRNLAHFGSWVPAEGRGLVDTKEVFDDSKDKDVPVDGRVPDPILVPAGGTAMLGVDPFRGDAETSGADPDPDSVTDGAMLDPALETEIEPVLEKSDLDQNLDLEYCSLFVRYPMYTDIDRQSGVMDLICSSRSSTVLKGKDMSFSDLVHSSVGIDTRKQWLVTNAGTC